MNIKPLLLYICFCGLLSCGHKDTGVKQVPITFQRVSIDGLLIGRANGMMIKGNNLLIADAMSDAVFYWIQLDKGTLQKVGSMGQGPDEYLRFETFYRTNGQCGFYDSRLWRCVDITFGEENIGLHKRGRCPLQNFSMIPTAFHTYIGIGPYEKGRFRIMDAQGHEISCMGEQPYRDQTERQIAERTRAMAYQGNIMISPDGKRLVHSIFTAPQLSVYQLTADSLWLIQSQIDSYPDYKPEENGDSYAASMSRHNKLGYVSLAVTDHYIYALYSGKTTAQHALSAFCGNAIRVFDWEGNYIKEFTFEEMDVSAFCVSENDQTIYAVGLADDYELFTCDIKI